ncbi:protein RESTRICTED TEV MOVEMENT 3-like [Dorcoceras hygrometricum]|uniref:Protein RESTRICTED TEV MOVEMENT 3-like n=1 Tax=Dorcoceras hygrometricum TaxID=472368 RepID=A0A2Z7A5M6_9LAMI|nr:protein RESTRICTED TEV MOVEMENT 3-like [Dorcoceras hygrometricum]
MGYKCYSAPELVKEDLMCHFGFNRKGVHLVGDLGRVAEGLEGESRRGLLGGDHSPKREEREKEGPQSTEKEARRLKKKGAFTFEAQTAPTTEMRGASTPPSPTQKERPAPTPEVLPAAIPDVPATEVGARTGVGPGRAIALNIFEDFFVVSPSRSVATGLLCNMILDRDVDRVRNAPDLEVLGSFAVRFAETMIWGDEVINRLTRARREVNASRQSLDEEHRATEAQREALEAQGKKLTAEKEALAVEKRAVKAELEALTIGKGALEAELEYTKARAEEEIQRLKGDAENVCGLGKEEFLKFSEFDDLCAKKSLAYFECGFKSCLVQFRVNDYTKEEHPTPFLSIARALEELPDDEEEADDGASGDEATPPSSLPMYCKLQCLMESDLSHFLYPELLTYKNNSVSAKRGNPSNPRCN